MSCYEWERVSVVLPSKDVVRFRKAMVAAWNAHQMATFAHAQTVRERVLALGKGKPNYPYRQIVTGWCWEHQADADKVKVWERLDTADRWLVGHLLYPRTNDPTLNTDTPSAPLKSALRLKKQSALQFEEGEVSVWLEPKTRTACYSVSENNHAKEHGRAHYMGEAFFQFLDTVDWVRGTGGVGTGNDEYNREDSSAGGGGNYETCRYGPRGGDPVGRKRPATSYTFSGRFFR